MIGLVAAVALVTAACASEEGGDPDLTLPEGVTLPETDVTLPEVTTTAAVPSEPDSGGSGGDPSVGSGESEGANETAIWAFVILGIVVVGGVAYFASRTGARQGAEDQRNAELAAQQRAEEAARQAQYEAPPPPPTTEP